MSNGIGVREHEALESAIADAIAVHARVGERCGPAIARAASTIIEALRAGGKVLVFGNGGSAADAQHLAAELVGRFQCERRGLAAVALTADTSVLTSVANDYTFERAFARQVEALGRSGDVAVAISTSGRSPNVIAALAAARLQGLRTVAFTGGGGGAVGDGVDVHVNVPSESTPRIQEAHRTLLHVLCDLVERAFV